MKKGEENGRVRRKSCHEEREREKERKKQRKEKREQPEENLKQEKEENRKPLSLTAFAAAGSSTITRCLCMPLETIRGGSPHSRAQACMTVRQ